jgi:predicted ArsR family transcriptional regulator
MSRAADALADAGMTNLMSRLYLYLCDHGPTERDALVQKLATPRTTVFDAAKMLEGIGLVKRFPFYHFGPMKRGRPKIMFGIVGRD